VGYLTKVNLISIDLDPIVLYLSILMAGDKWFLRRVKI